MSSETEEQETPDADAATDANPAAGETIAADSSASDENLEIGSPEFQEVSAGQKTGVPAADLNRFQDIKVNVSADLGRAEVPIQTLMNIGEGSVLELNRSIDSPVELVAQGVPLACGEVVVVNGCFAIRVTEVYEHHKG